MKLNNHTKGSNKDEDLDTSEDVKHHITRLPNDPGMFNESQYVVFYTEFVLLGFPGIVAYRKFLVIPFLSVYATILTGNLLIIYRICRERSLQSPMYILISILFTVNISCTTSIIPKLILGLSFDLNDITLAGCLVQMFYIYFMAIFESAIILSMALDRYVAICRPLRYNEIMTKQTMVYLVIIGISRSTFFVSPMVILASYVQYCKSNIILNFVCENMGLLSLACGDISKQQIVGLLVRIIISVLDFCLLLFSYSSILYTAMKIISGKARHKALHTCGMHLLVAMLIYTCAMVSSIMYRMHSLISYDVQNLFNAIYLMIPAMLNPFIYGLGVKEIRQSLMKSWKKRSLVLSFSMHGHINKTFVLRPSADEK
ncbi:olfactory receptor 52Z1-like [Bufo bufo]|uniref:olfactory receptor 52Z1-like n=1 Tax=Bufo bufo TaxID=8384 RepID=UPI001ABE196F|nr:olfactory receptor 52Z1-like [Bufo bufo]